MKKNKNGFTLIELLAVIIILGILMIIAIPSVTKYISDSRKSTYIDTAKELISGARNKVNDGKLQMFDTNSTYYIPSSCIKTENASKSPYGDFTEAYIAVIYNGKGYKYYWISVDDSGQGVKNIIPLDMLDENDIESDLTDEEIKFTVEHVGIGERTEIKILNCESEEWRNIHLDDISNNVSEKNGGASGSDSGNGGDIVPPNYVCKKVTDVNKLHIATCTSTVSNRTCGATVGYGNEIQYGTISNGTLKSGDAFDCDVNDDGIYNSDTERFYYITSYDNKAVLIFYNNYYYGGRYGGGYGSNAWNGPTSAYTSLPSLSEWDNKGIIAPGTREIINDLGEITVNDFTYSDKAARLLTKQELETACGEGVSVLTSIYTDNYLNNCKYLMENIKEFEKGTGGYGYWLETPVSTENNAYYVNGYYLCLLKDRINYYDTRPVIEVEISNIEH